jgi:ketosteroid isomerase-like protein
MQYFFIEFLDSTRKCNSLLTGDGKAEIILAFPSTKNVNLLIKNNLGENMISDEQKKIVLNALVDASEKWKMAFNTGDAKGCASQYEPEAVMVAKPFGTFTGTKEITAFWQKLIDDGFSDVDYIDPKIEVLDESSAVLSSGWQMNKAKGVITKELWVLQRDGTAKLRIDEFEAQG